MSVDSGRRPRAPFRASRGSPGETSSPRLARAARRREELGRLPDADLVACCVDGDERAWETLVRRYRRLVYAVPNRAGLDEQSVEEVFHQTFARLAGSIGSIRDRSRVRAWIVTTARRLTIDCIRARRESRELDDSEDVLTRISDSQELPSESLERLERQHLVRQALLRIGDSCRRLLSLLFYHSSDQPPSYESISEELGIPIGSIGPTRARCLNKLLVEYRRVEEE